MTRPTDWDFSKVSGKGETPARSEAARGEMPAFVIDIEKREAQPRDALPWADVEFERISKTPRRAPEPAQPVAVKRRFPRFRLRRVKRATPRAKRDWPTLPAFRLPRFQLPRFQPPRIQVPRPALPRVSLPRVRLPRVALPAMPRVSMPRIALPEMPRVSIPRISVPRVAVPRLSVPHITLPQMAMPRVRMPAVTMPHFSRPAPMRRMVRKRRHEKRPVIRRAPVDWRAPIRHARARAVELRAPAMRGLRSATFGIRVVVVAFTWIGAELFYVARLGYAHARIALPRLAYEARGWSAGRFSAVDLRPLARQAAIAALFIFAGYGAVAIVGPVLKKDEAEVAVLPPPATPEAAEPDIEDTKAVIASLDRAVPLPMPRIAHAPVSTQRKTAALRTASTGLERPGNQRLGRQLMPASQSNHGGIYGSDLISEIQIRLLRLGYPAGPPTGTLNARTRRAITLYQRDQMVPISGEADMRLVRRLRDDESRDLQFAGR